MVRLLNKPKGLAWRLVLGLLSLSAFTLGGIALAAWSWSSDAAGHDRWVLQAFGGKQRGFFVQVPPAADWTGLSNSLLVESNWTGLCVEVVGQGTRQTTQGATGRATCRHDYVQTQGQGLGLPARTLADVLRAAGAPSVIEYLAIDFTHAGEVVLAVRTRLPKTH
jgi:hypothetical protein